MTRPDFIGSYAVAGKLQFYGATAEEIDRASFAVSRVLRSFAFRPGSNILTISMIPEIVQYGSFERAVQMLGLYGLNADDSPFDAGRVEAIARQFDPVAVCGVGKATLDGLAMFGHDPSRIFRGRVVWARPDAYAAISAMPGVMARRVVSVGPALALECASGSVHYDNREWSLREVDGTIVLVSRLQRVEPVDELDTGIEGRCGEFPCACGDRDRTLIFGA